MSNIMLYLKKMKKVNKTMINTPVFSVYSIINNIERGQLN